MFFTQPLTPKNQGAPATAAKLLGPAIVVLRCTADPPGGWNRWGNHEFVSWDDDIPIWKFIKQNHVPKFPKHQPTYDLWHFLENCDVFIGRLGQAFGYLWWWHLWDISRRRILGIQLKQVAQTIGKHMAVGKNMTWMTGHCMSSSVIIYICICMYIYIYLIHHDASPCWCMCASLFINVVKRANPETWLYKGCLFSWVWLDFSSTQ